MSESNYRRWKTREVALLTPDRTASEIGGMIGRSASSVHNYARVNGYTIRKPQAKVTTMHGYAELRSRALQMTGSLDYVAAELKVHRMSVYRWRRDAGQTRSRA